MKDKKCFPPPGREIEELANRAANMRREDLRREKYTGVAPGQARGMKYYFKLVLRMAELKITDTRLSQMGRIIGARGGKKTARLVRAGLVVKKTRTTKPPRFNEFLFNIR